MAECYIFFILFTVTAKQKMAKYYNLISCLQYEYDRVFPLLIFLMHLSKSLTIMCLKKFLIFILLFLKLPLTEVDLRRCTLHVNLRASDSSRLCYETDS